MPTMALPSARHMSCQTMHGKVVMNILFVHNAYQQYGGEDAVVASEIALLRAYGHRVALYHRHNDELRPASEGNAPMVHCAEAAVASPGARTAAPELQPDMQGYLQRHAQRSLPVQLSPHLHGKLQKVAQKTSPPRLAKPAPSCQSTEPRPPSQQQALAHAAAALSALWSVRSIRELGALCTVFQPDVIHVHNTFPLISPSIYWMASARGIPVVQTLHNFRLLCPQGTFLRNGRVCEDCLGNLPWRAVTRKCYRDSVPQSAVLALMLGTHRAAGTYRHRVTRYIALNAFARARFIGAGLRPEQVCIKPNFVDCVAPPAPQVRLGGLYVGRLSAEKGVQTLLAAVCAGNVAMPTVIGAGPLAHDAAQVCGDRYLGFRAREEIMDAMGRHAFLLVPSLCLEQLPTTILEAFAAGLPVIASRVGPLPDIVKEHVTGLLFEPGNASDLAEKIAWADAHGAEMAQMGRNARAEYEANYTPSINYRMLLEIYDDAIAAIQKARRAP
jgi:glycosyltransferase involved in cell wall biosynthesis